MTIHELLEKDEFVGAVHYSLEKVIKLLLSEDIPFSILANMSFVNFEPDLPKEISDNFKPITLFDLYGYTLSSASLKNGIFSFEAGFGSEDFASLVTLPQGAILQIAVDDTPIFLNMSIPKTDEANNSIRKSENKKEDGTSRSMNAFLNNPENERLFKK